MLPDVDLIAGMLLHRDPFRLHRKLTHSPGFTTALGGLAGLTGIISAGSVEGERDLIADALMGAAIMSSHVAVDRVKLPIYRLSRPGMSVGRVAANEAVNSVIDAVAYGGLAWRLWPREQAREG
jgi:hypothetical protein